MKVRRNTHGVLLFLIVLIGLTAGMPAIAAQEQGASAPQPAAPAPAVEPGPVAAQAGSAPPEMPFGIVCPPEYVPLVQKTTLALMSNDFSFYPVKALDPFVPFIVPETSAAQVRITSDDDEEKTEADRPLTPLQKMTVTEIERGLKAITWGDLGRKAVIEDSTGKGFIVAVGTPAGERNGVITQIFNDRLVIQQEIWDRKVKKRLPQDFVVKLSKKTTERQ